MIVPPAMLSSGHAEQFEKRAKKSCACMLKGRTWSGLKASLSPRRHGMQFAGRVAARSLPGGELGAYLRRIADASRSGWHEMAADWPLKTGAACCASAWASRVAAGARGFAFRRRGGACGYPCHKSVMRPCRPSSSIKKGAGGRTRGGLAGVKLGDLAFNQIIVASAAA